MEQFDQLVNNTDMETMEVDVQFQNYFESDLEQTQEQNLERLY